MTLLLSHYVRHGTAGPGARIAMYSDGDQIPDSSFGFYSVGVVMGAHYAAIIR